MSKEPTNNVLRIRLNTDKSYEWIEYEVTAPAGYTMDEAREHIRTSLAIQIEEARITLLTHRRMVDSLAPKPEPVEEDATIPEEEGVYN